MRKNALFVSAAAFILGIAGFVTRTIELSIGYEPDTGLPIHSSAVVNTMIWLSLIVILLAGALGVLLRHNYTSKRTYGAAFAPAKMSYFLFTVVLGVLWLAATVAHAFIAYTSGAPTTQDLAYSILSVLAAVSVMMLGHNAFTGRAGSAMLFFSLVPEVFLTLWLVILFSVNQTNPVLLSYSYQGLAIASSALGFFFVAGYVYGKPGPGKLSFSLVCAIFFNAVALADRTPLPTRAIFAVMLVFHSVSLVRFLLRLEKNEL
ncbi:MAG: hypothetical protein LBN30_10160 [Oscillospiraceae bacterium]|jgi:hypothetical protein|nr:hypothetical protein [Oscillospiraceae bacterium]